jgi:hypothetical protein
MWIAAATASIWNVPRFRIAKNLGVEHTLSSSESNANLEHRFN